MGAVIEFFAYLLASLTTFLNMLLSLPICIITFTGSLFHSEFSTHLLHLSGGAFLAALHPTCLIFVDLSLTSHPVELCVLEKGRLLVF